MRCLTKVTTYSDLDAHMIVTLPSSDGTVRSSVFSRLLGDNFIDVAFKAARAADPVAKLYING